MCFEIASWFVMRFASKRKGWQRMPMSKRALEHHGSFSTPVAEEKIELQERWAAAGDKAM